MQFLAPHNLLSRCVVKIIYQLCLAEIRFVSNVVPALIRLKVCQNRIMLFYLRIHLSLYSLKILHQTTTTTHKGTREVSLYLLKILHQTTTRKGDFFIFLSCTYLKFYIKPQPLGFILNTSSGCIHLKFYIKPQPPVSTQMTPTGCIHLKFYIKPQLFCTNEFSSGSCIHLKFYIKPQLALAKYFCNTVVST